jgi:DNA-binding CsgD family transcriptional regulator
MGLPPKLASVPPAELRPTGIPPVPEVAWGKHIAIFFGTADDLLEIIGGYFNAGLAGNEKCLWVTSDPLTVDQALAGLSEYIPDLNKQYSRGAVEVLAGEGWYLTDGTLDAERVKRAWLDSADQALQRGFDGLRVVGNAFWLNNNYWESFSDYECDLSSYIRGTRMIILCTYPLDRARASDVLDITKAHDFAIALRNGRWEFLESPELAIARREIDRLHNAIDVLSLPFPGRERLTPRERITLAQIVLGASNKEAARALNISPRTVEFHRSNIMRKLNARNVAELMKIVLSGV